MWFYKCVYYRRVTSVLWMKTQGNNIPIWLSSKYIRKGYAVFYLQWSLFLPIKTQISRLKQLIVFFFNLPYEWLDFVLSNVTLIASPWPFSFLRCSQISVVINAIHWSNTVWIFSKTNLLWLTYRWVNLVFMAKTPDGSSLIWLPYKYLVLKEIQCEARSSERKRLQVPPSTYWPRPCKLIKHRKKGNKK